MFRPSFSTATQFAINYAGREHGAYSDEQALTDDKSVPGTDLAKPPLNRLDLTLPSQQGSISPIKLNEDVNSSGQALSLQIWEKSTPQA
jgi:hypothetical protein